MRHNRVAEAHFWRSMEVFPETCLVASNTAGTVIADAHAVRYSSTREGRDPLPDGGWEQVVVWAFADAEQGVAPIPPVPSTSAWQRTYRAKGWHV